MEILSAGLYTGFGSAVSLLDVFRLLVIFESLIALFAFELEGFYDVLKDSWNFAGSKLVSAVRTTRFFTEPAFKAALTKQSLAISTLGGFFDNFHTDAALNIAKSSLFT